MQQRKSQNIQPQKTEVEQRRSLQQQPEEEQITQQTIERFNKICIDATEVMNEYKNQSIALKEEIADIVSVYTKSSSNTDAVPVEKIISITNEYEQGMRQANREYHHLTDELKNEEKERDQIVFQIKDCFDKLERMEVKIKEKKRRQLEKKQLLQSGKKLQETVKTQEVSVTTEPTQAKPETTQQNQQPKTENQTQTKQQQ